jgi:hypothetical protein
MVQGYQNRESPAPLGALLSALCVFLFKDFNGHVRADLSTHGAAGTLPGIFKKDEMISFFVKIFCKANHFFGTGNQAKLTTFTPFSIDVDLSHHSFPISNLLGRR